MHKAFVSQAFTHSSNRKIWLRLAYHCTVHGYYNLRVLKQPKNAPNMRKTIFTVTTNYCFKHLGQILCLYILLEGSNFAQKAVLPYLQHLRDPANFFYTLKKEHS